MSNLNVSNGLQNCKPSHHLSFEWNHCLGPTGGTLVATGGGDAKGFLWKIGHKKSVSSFAFNTDGQLFASGSFDGLVQMGDINSGNLKCTLDGHNGGIEWIRWHPKGHLVLAERKLCASKLLKQVRVITSRDILIASLSIKFLTGVFFCLCKDATQSYVQILDVIQKAILDFEGCLLHLFKDPSPAMTASSSIDSCHSYHTEGLTCLTITSDSTLALTGSKDIPVHIVNITTGKPWVRNGLERCKI
ncbi:unnamed protein product [Camellia sinensis]